MNEAKPFVIDKRLVWEAYHKVKENKGSADIDKVDQKTFDKEMSKNLYKIWNRMSSGCYFPKAVKNYINERLTRWVMRKYKRFSKGKKLGKAYDWLVEYATHNRSEFSHWVKGFVPYPRLG